MRNPVDASAVTTLLEKLGNRCRGAGTVYLTGGGSAVLFGWRETTIDVDLKFLPEPDGIFDSIPSLKNELNLNLELAAPDDFVPALPGWKERSRWIATHNRVDFYHFDFYTQALSKLERAHAKDHLDVRAMVEEGLIEPLRLRELVEGIDVAQWSRYPSLEPETILAEVTAFAQKYET